MKIIAGLCIGVLLGTVFWGCQAKLAKDEAVIVKIADGDTFTISLNGRNEKVRLIGIDTPESKRNKKAKKDAGRSGEDLETIVSLGKEAAEFVRGIIKPGDRVRIETDVRERDQYGRLLAYVYLSDGRMLNDVIIRSGYASPLTYPPNVRYEQQFLEAYRQARQQNRGLWRQ